MPLPFANYLTKLPTASRAEFARSAFRTFVSRQPLASDYTAAIQIVLDVLADVVLDETKRITSHAVLMMDGGESD
jgi:hypothetical protein